MRDAFESAGQPVPNNAPVASGLSPAQKACDEYMRKGYRHLFWEVSSADMLAHLGKGPRERGWQDLEYTLPPQGGHYQVGLKLGTEMKTGPFTGMWLCCVDIDDPRLQDLAESALPKTDLVGGREGARRSHFFYFTDRPCNSFSWGVEDSKAASADPETPSTATCLIELFGVKKDGGVGHQVVVAPSIHFKTGQRYVWDCAGDPGITTPERLFEALDRVASTVPGSRITKNRGSAPAFKLSDARTRVKANDASRECSEDPRSKTWKLSDADIDRVILRAWSDATKLQKGSRQRGLNSLSFCAASVLEGSNAHQEAFDRLAERLISAAEDLPPPAVDMKVWADTVERAIRDGRANPRRRSLLQSFPLTDQGTTDLLQKEFQDHYRYVTEWRSWITWNGMYWERTEDEDLMRDMAPVFRWAVGETLNIENKAFRQQAGEYYFKAESRSKAANVEKLLRASMAAGKGLGISAIELDKDPLLFNCRNGTYDIAKGELREQRRTDLITKCAAKSFIPGASNKRFLDHLSYIFGECEDAPDLCNYFGLWLGYCMTGLNTEQKIMVIHGNGCNGKSKTFEAVADVMGDYSGILKREVLIATRTDSRNSDEVADLQGVRFAFFSEAAPTDFLSEGRIKSLTGGESVTAMRKYEGSFKFEMTCKLCMDTNYVPRIRGTDLGILRRVKMVPFKRLIPESMKDIDFKKKLVSHEGNGLLTWLLERSHEWFRRGNLGPEPLTVAKESAGFANDNDHLGNFILDCCITRDTDTSEPPRPANQIVSRSGELYSKYQQWARANGYSCVNSRNFANKLVDKGYIWERKKFGVVWYGLEIMPSDQAFDAFKSAHEQAFTGGAAGGVGDEARHSEILCEDVAEQQAQENYERQVV